MTHAALPKITTRPAPRRYAIVLPRAQARLARAESLAAPLTLAAVVLGALVLAIASAIAGALGG